MNKYNEEIENLPEGYDSSIPRVSNILEFIFPFEGTENERRYLEWLAKNNIKQEEYLAGSQELGTEIHKQLEDYINKWIIIDELSDTEISKEVAYWRDWLDRTWGDNFQTKVYIKEANNRFQGSCDLLYEDYNWNKILADWKTYWIVKKRYWLPNKFIVPPDKKKKVQLQLSFYAYWLKQQWIKVDKAQLLFLHEDWIKVVDLDILPDREIEHHLTLFEAQQQNKDIKILLPNIDKDMFEIEILEPTKQYWNVKVRVDLAKIDNWDTAQETIDKAIRTVKYLVQELKD